MKSAKPDILYTECRYIVKISLLWDLKMQTWGEEKVGQDISVCE